MLVCHCERSEAISTISLRSLADSTDYADLMHIAFVKIYLES